MLNRHYLSGPDSGIDLNTILGGGEPGSPQAEKAAAFYGKVLGFGFRDLAASDEGQTAINKAFLQVSLPLSLLAFAAGYWFAKQRGRG